MDVSIFTDSGVRGMFNRILVPTDFSESSANALKVAQESFPGAQIKLIHVVDEDAPPNTEDLSQLLQAWDGAELAFGNPAQVVMETIKEWGADLVVMAVCGRSGWGMPFYHSLAEWFMHESPVPVLAIHPEPTTKGTGLP